MRRVPQAVPEGKPHTAARPLVPKLMFDKFCLQRNQLTKHRPIHDNTQFVCPYCPNAKSVKAKSTMQKHLRALHEDRIEEWKVPGFVNALLTTVDAHNTSASSVGSGDAGADDPADSNNNLDRLLGLAGAGSAVGVRQKRPGEPDSPQNHEQKRFRLLSADGVDDVSSSCTTPMLAPIMVGAGGQEPPLFGRQATNSGGLYNGMNGGSFTMFDASSGSVSASSTAYGTPQKQQLDRFHQKLDSLEIVDANQMQIAGVEGHAAQVTADALNGGVAAAVNGTDVMSSGHLMMVNGAGGGGAVSGVWNNFGVPLAAATAGGEVGGGESEAEERGSYENFYEDYMVL